MKTSIIIILSNIAQDTAEFIQSDRFLYGYLWNGEIVNQEPNVVTVPSDCRVDVPVWFGDLPNAQHRVVVIGKEPRDTHPKFNIEKVGNKVFAAPFGVDRWNHNSTVPRKPQLKYFRVFESLVGQDNFFVIFTDAVKEYVNDEDAARTFWQRAEEESTRLLQELEIINPTIVIALGNASFEFINTLVADQFRVKKVRHPSRGGTQQALEEVDEIMRCLLAGNP